MEEQVRKRTAELSDAEASLRKRTEQLQAAFTDLTLTEQRERRRLAAVLHDHLQQILVAASLRVESLGGEGPIQAAADKIGQLLKESLAVSRSLTAELSPPVLRDGDLVLAVKLLAEWVEQTHGLAVTIDTPEECPQLPEDVAVLLFESIRELLFNVVKYADVDAARIEVRRQREGELRVSVVDAGRGFNPVAMRPTGKTGGFGLFMIRERLDLFGGKVEINSAPGQGSRITLTVPVKPPLPPAALPASVRI